MDSSPQKASSDQGGSYAGGYSGYNASGFNESSTRRTLQDYLLILRERVWYIVVVFLVVFSSVLVYTLGQTKVYESVATMQVFRREAQVMGQQVQKVLNNDIIGAEDLNTQVKVIESSNLIRSVASRLSAEEVRRLMLPYETGRASDPRTPEEVIFLNRKIVPQRLSLVIAVSFRHPDKVLAAKVANLFVDEYIGSTSRLRIDESSKAFDDIKVRADQQRKKVEELANKLQAYREKNELVSLAQGQDIVTESMKAQNLLLTQSSARRKDAEVRWNQVQERRASGGDLTELSFIAGQQIIAPLLQQIAAQQIQLAQLRERYREKHPKMIEMTNSLGQVRRELERTLLSATAAVEAEYQTALRSETEARKALAEKETASLRLGKFAVEYDNLEREVRINEEILSHLLGRMREVSLIGTLDAPQARKLDAAAEAVEPATPNVPLNLAVGFVGGLGLGLAFAFFVAFIDDRVKSSFDIESVVGLPLIGVIPQIKRMEQPDKAQIVASNADRQVAEAFLALHSTLRLKDESKNAKCILVTSTIPGEGKSFTTTNLALTFAAHGERVCVVDCDLRKPNIHKSFRIENLKGVIDVCAGQASIDDVVIRNVHPNLDIIPAGGRAKNPTQVLNSKGFELFLSDLRKRYDRVFVDTPPLAAVSDSLIVLPLVDGSVFTILFNRVRRKAVQYAARKLLETNVPNFGAVLNGLNLAVSGYYYAQYYDKSYKDYYVVSAKEDASSPEK